MSGLRVSAGPDGGTTLTALPLAAPPDLPGEQLSKVIESLPATVVELTRFLEAGPALGPHPAPRRQLVVVLQGGFEIAATDGGRARLGPGDCLLCDDVGSEGHTYENVGVEQLVALSVVVPDEWEWPGR